MRCLFVVLGLAATACGSSANPSGAGRCADVERVEATAAADGSFTFAVTIASADTGWDEYADAFDVVAPTGSVLGTRVLVHPHVDEQPFTRSLTGVEVPAGVDRVTVRAHDSVAGSCGAEISVDLP